MIGNAHIQWDVLCFKWYHHFLSRSVVKHVVIFLNSLFSKSHTIPHSEYCTALCLRHIRGWSFAVALRNFARRAFLGYFSHSKKKKREQAIASSQEQNRLFLHFFRHFFGLWFLIPWKTIQNWPFLPSHYLLFRFGVNALSRNLYVESNFSTLSLLSS